ncbi:MAG: hypothetical protein H6858_04855 [Rhodospirillales bacterium]|nr:hypothetical protein [Saprospiraceae bacterium]MCB9976914.1 hypothetical protein [Rhodospirillales bacterium]
MKNVYRISIVATVVLLSVFIAGQRPQVVEKTINVKELVNMDAREFVDIIRNNRLTHIESLGGGEGVDERYRLYRFHFIKNWPRREDIPYLLSLVNSNDRCGALENIYSAFHLKVSQTNRKVSDLSVILLSAIKNGEFHIHSDIGPLEDREGIISWAKAEASKLEP